MSEAIERSKVKGLKYHGDGTAFLSGIPGRDLDAEDLAQLTDDQIAQALAASVNDKPLYEPVGTAPRAPRTPKAEEESE